MAQYLLDTNALVEWLRGRPAIVELFADLVERDQVLALNPITVAETYSGLAESERGPADRIVQSLEFWDIGASAAKLAGDFRYRYAREGRQISLPDALIGALAVSRNATLITANVKDFPMPGLNILPLPPR